MEEKIREETSHLKVLCTNMEDSAELVQFLVTVNHCTYLETSNAEN